MTIVYIHGANSTGESFNYIRQHLGQQDEVLIEYDSRDGFDCNLKGMKRIVEDVSDVQFICHSLGGIYALHLADAFPKHVRGAVTISTPYGGAESADYAKYFLPFTQLLKDIGPNSYPIRSANSIKVQHPWMQIVTTKGDSPWIFEPNDGVVTLKSMRHRKDVMHIDLHTNHYEVVMSPRTVGIIQDFISTVGIIQDFNSTGE